MMRRNASSIVFIISILVLFQFFGVSFCSNLEKSPSRVFSPSFPRIVLFSWDGVQYNHFTQLYSAGGLPNVKKLTNEGIFVKAYITDHDTTTNPGHVALLTGSGGPDICPDDLTVLEKIEDWNSSWVTGCIAGKSKFSDTIFPSYVYSDVDYWYAGDVYSNVCADLAIDFVKSYSASSFFLFVHFRDPDSAGHSYGENSQQYEDALVECDTQMGRILSALDSQGILNSTAIVLTADHGFMEGGKGHETSPYPTGDPNTYTTFIVCNQGTVEPLGWGWDQNDVAPTLYSLMGIGDYSSRFLFLKGFALWDRAYGLARRYAESFLVNGTAFNVFIVSNSTVSNIAFNQTDKNISFESVGGSFSNVTIPRQMLDEAFLVVIDGVRASCALTSDSTCSYLFFTYSGDAHEVRIWNPVFVPVNVRICPKSLNLRSQGKWITGYIKPPEGYSVSDIEVSTILLNNTVPAERSDVQDGALMVRFDKGDIKDLIRDVLDAMYGNVTLTITGEFSDGTLFEGSDTIRTIDKQAVDTIMSLLF